jgi:hypothetical protein
MGKAFRDRGVEFRRREEFASKLQVPGSLQGKLGTSSALVVSVSILVGPKAVLYADITETYRGDTRWPKLFGQPSPHTMDNLNLLATLLNSVVDY